MRHRAPSLSAFNKRPAKASAFAESISGFFVEADIPSILRTYIADANANFRKVAEARISWLMRCLSRRRRLDDRQILLSKHRDGLCQIGSRRSKFVRARSFVPISSWIASIPRPR